MDFEHLVVGLVDIAQPVELVDVVVELIIITKRSISQ
jgi:hypothetical protein